MTGTACGSFGEIGSTDANGFSASYSYNGWIVSSSNQADTVSDLDRDDGTLVHSAIDHAPKIVRSVSDRAVVRNPAPRLTPENPSFVLRDRCWRAGAQAKSTIVAQQAGLRTRNQKMTVAAMQIADMKVWVKRS